ncbi:HDIG domain-containing protein [Chitinophagaceae bacterium 26-R-25]|nr:HDIG domain-containing protein [Chitinophagaceae bacterium 26-R-25]
MNEKMNQYEIIADEIIGLYKDFGSADYIGEPVSQIEHMCQAAQLAEEEGFDDEVVLAAFFHDIGHICETEVESMDGYGAKDHEEMGAEFLHVRGFSEKIIKLVLSHVATKRFLTQRYPAYYNKLSEASKITLAHQGGPMSEEEASVYESHPLFPLFIKIREWDDKAKVENVPLPSLEHYREMMVRHLSRN